VSSICFLVSVRGEAHNDNAERLPAAFAAEGWQVTVHDHNELCLTEHTLRAGSSYLDDVDLVWPLGLGERSSFLDRAQLLLGVKPARMVTSAHALLCYHAKLDLVLGPLSAHHPETHAGRDAQWLAELVEAGGEWIAKPTAASYGRSVFRVSKDDPNLRVIFDELTGNGTRYCLLQRYLPEIEDGETRVLFANGRLIGSYRRLPFIDHRVNINGSGRAVAHDLSGEERVLATRAAEHLLGLGARFVAVDLVYPYILECNIANPGGLGTLEALGGEDLSYRVVGAFGGKG
jgi:glutathione synthase